MTKAFASGRWVGSTKRPYPSTVSEAKNKAPPKLHRQPTPEASATMIATSSP